MNPPDLDPVERLAPEECFAGALFPAGDAPGAASTHPSFATLKNRVCMRAADGKLVRIVDFTRHEYWGERLLLVETPSGDHRGLSWTEPESRLVELATKLQSYFGSFRLGSIEAPRLARIEAALSARWGALCEQRALAKTTRNTAAPESASPRL